MRDSLFTMLPRDHPAGEPRTVRFHIGRKAYNLQIPASIQAVHTRPGRVIEMPAAKNGMNIAESQNAGPR